MGGGTAVGDLKCSLNAGFLESHTREEAGSLDAKGRIISPDYTGDWSANGYASENKSKQVHRKREREDLQMQLSRLVSL